MKSPAHQFKRVALVLGARHNFWLDQRVLRTARALVSDGYHIFACTPIESRVGEYTLQNVTTRYISTPGANNTIFKKLQLDYLLYNIPAAFNLKKNRVDICHCNDFDTLPCGVLLKLLSWGKIKIIYDSHEDYPLFVEEGHGKLLAKIIGIIETVLTKIFVDRVISVNETITSRFMKMGLQTETIFNCQELPNNNTISEKRIVNSRDGEFNVVYQGNIARLRGYEQLIQAVDILVNTRKIYTIKFTIIGRSVPDESYIEYINDLIIRKGLEDYFVFTGFINYDQMMQILRQADAGLILYQPTPNNKLVLPNKLFENLAAGIPTIAGNFPELGKLISEEKSGLLIDPTQPQEIADAIEYLYRDKDSKLEMGRNALQAARERYNFVSQAEKLQALYRGIY
jgi:glycosyltransferase involved in cell wall biosynthesis